MSLFSVKASPTAAIKAPLNGPFEETLRIK
jgi:hypothetical protein